MAITAYEVEGKTLYRVRVNLRSPTVAGLRIERKAKGLKSETEAKKLERKFEREVERAMMEKEGEGHRWGKMIDDWEEAALRGDVFVKKISLKTIEYYASTLRKYTDEWFLTPTNQIDKSMAWQVMEKVEREISIARRKKLRTAIDAVFNWAITSGKVNGIQSLPTEGYKTKIKEEDKMPEILNLVEIKTLLKSARESEHNYYPIWALALLTGMRSGELYALRWDKVDFESKLMYVHENWTNKDGMGATKGRYWRTIPLSQELETFLKELKIKTGGYEEEVWKWASDNKTERKFFKCTDFVLPRYQSWKDGRQAEVLRTFCEGIGIQSVRFHTLRACFATQLIKDGIAPAVIMKICGWRELKTMQRYVRLAGIEVKGATEGLKILPPEEAMGRVVELFGAKS